MNIILAAVDERDITKELDYTFFAFGDTNRKYDQEAPSQENENLHRADGSKGGVKERGVLSFIALGVALG